MGVVPGVPPPAYFPAYQPGVIPAGPPQSLNLPPGAPLPAQGFVPGVIPPVSVPTFPGAPFNPTGL